jgi:hypothetical protein
LAAAALSFRRCSWSLSIFFNNLRVLSAAHFVYKRNFILTTYFRSLSTGILYILRYGEAAQRKNAHKDTTTTFFVTV